MVGAVWLVRQLCVVPNDGKRRQLLQVEGEIHAEVCAEQGCDGDCRHRGGGWEHFSIVRTCLVHGH